MRKTLFLLLALSASPAHAFTVDPVAAVTDEATCFKLNLYHEARGESMKAIIEVMKVVLARAHSPEFPGTICDVTWQRTNRDKVAAFSWTRDGRPDNDIRDVAGWRKVSLLVDYFFAGKLHIPKEPELKFYQTGPINGFFKKLNFVKQVGAHAFYSE